MAHQLRVQVRLPVLDGVPENAITNTLYCDGGDVGASPEDLANDFHGPLAACYLLLASYMSDTLATLGEVKYYNLSDPPHSPPILTLPLSIPSANRTHGALPHEVAICVSFEGEEDGVPVANRRGRLYLGPMSLQTIVETGGQVFVDPAAVSYIANAFRDLMDANDVDKAWAVFSPTWHNGRGPTGGGRPGGRGPLPAIDPHSIAESTFDVVKVWVDNAFDTVRSRGPKATTRQTRVLTP